ncbi:MAG: LAGLIDADG family homing endonuclease [Candidatus Aenigmatarchaeota archaeon]
MTTLKPIKNQLQNLTPAKARIIARLKGDGALFRSGTNYIIKYEVKDIEQLNSFASDIKEVFGLDMKWLKHISGITGKLLDLVQLRSKLAFEDLNKFGKFKSENWNIPKEIFESSKEVKREFIKALFDDEGSVIIGDREIRLYSINKKGLEEMMNLLVEFNIKSKIKIGYGKKRNVFALVIEDKKSMENFSNKIGFSLERKQAKLLDILSTWPKASTV